jgi:hypothetical protein
MPWISYLVHGVLIVMIIYVICALALLDRYLPHLLLQCSISSNVQLRCHYLSRLHSCLCSGGID